jgi:hypothetical protein
MRGRDLFASIAARRQAIDAALAEIGRSGRDDWREAIERALAAISAAKDDRGAFPSRKEARAALANVARSARALADELAGRVHRRHDMRREEMYIELIGRRGARDDTLDFASLPLALAWLAKRADAARERLEGEGRFDVAGATGRPDDVMLVAAFATEAIKMLDGKPPGRANMRAMRFCSALWKAAGRPPRASATTEADAEIRVWEADLREAQKGRKGARPARRSAIARARFTASSCLEPVRNTAKKA